MPPLFNDFKNAFPFVLYLLGARCGLVQYCNAVCQKNHWPEHKSECNAHKMAKETWDRDVGKLNSENNNTSTKNIKKKKKKVKKKKKRFSNKNKPVAKKKKGKYKSMLIFFNLFLIELWGPDYPR